MTGNLKGAFKGAFTGAIAGMAGGYANFGKVGGWADVAKRVGVSALGGCASGKASGGSCKKGAGTAALVQALTIGASEAYRKVSSPKYNKSGKPHLWQEGKSDVGKQLDQETLLRIKKGELKPPLSSDQSAFMQKVGKGPYMDAFAEFHDGLHDFILVPDDQFSLIATMPPSYLVTVTAAMSPYSYVYYLGSFEEDNRR